MFVPVVLLLDQVVTGAECHQVGIVSRRWDGDGAGTPDVRVAELIRQALELVGVKVVVVPEDVIVARPARALVDGQQ